MFYLLIRCKSTRLFIFLLGKSPERWLITMKNKLLIIQCAVMLTLFITFLAREVLFCSEQQTIRFNEAVRIMKREYLMRMNEAERERNINKLIYYRHQYDNAGKVVMELGADTIIQNFAKKNSY